MSEPRFTGAPVVRLGGADERRADMLVTLALSVYRLQLHANPVTACAEPAVGDWVVETSTRDPEDRWRRFGRLVEVRDEPRHGTVYVVENIHDEPTTTTWRNACVRVVLAAQ